MRQLTTLQRHELPAGNRDVARAAGAIAPAAAAKVLGENDELKGLLRHVLDGRIVRHGVAFAKRDRGQRLRIHGAFLEIDAVRGHPGAHAQIVQPALDNLLMLAFLVGISGAEERQQS